MDDLARLAALHGIATAYQPAPDVTVQVPEATIRTVLGVLGVVTDDAESIRGSAESAAEKAARRLLPPTVVLWQGEPVPPLPAGLPPGSRVVVVAEESGEEFAWGPGLPLGVHRITAEAPDGRTAGATLVVAPERAPAAPGRAHGLLVQLYSFLSERSWGMGDLGDLAELARWAARTHGADFVQVNPLHAALPGTPTDPSPYRPSSRRFPDPVHLRIEDVPEYADCTEREALAELAARGAALRHEVLEKGALIDRDAVWALKRQALELLYAVPRTPNGKRTTARSARREGRRWTSTRAGRPRARARTRGCAPISTAGWCG